VPMLPAPGQRMPLDRYRSIHLVIGPGGVLLIDSKQHRGRLRLDPYGMLWQGRHLLVSALGALHRAGQRALSAGRAGEQIQRPYIA
jgi:hypothetical protein